MVLATQYDVLKTDTCFLVIDLTACSFIKLLLPKVNSYWTNAVHVGDVCLREKTAEEQSEAIDEDYQRLLIDSIR